LHDTNDVVITAKLDRPELWSRSLESCKFVDDAKFSTTLHSPVNFCDVFRLSNFCHKYMPSCVCDIGPHTPRP